MPIWRCPEDYTPNETSIRFCRRYRLTDEQIEDMVFEMQDFEFKREHKDWDATFRNWIRKKVKWGEITTPRTTTYQAEELTPEQRAEEQRKWEADMKRLKVVR